MIHASERIGGIISYIFWRAAGEVEDYAGEAALLRILPKAK